MGQFGIALQMAFDEAGWSQAEAASRSGVVSQPTIGRYLRGVSLPEPEILEALVRQMSPRVQEKVVVAYLSDQVPASVGDKVRVEISDGKRELGEELVYGRAPNGSILKKDLETLERLALKDPHLAKALNYMAASLEGRALGSSPYDEDPLAVHEDADDERPEERILAKHRKKKAKMPD